MAVVWGVFDVGTVYLHCQKCKRCWLPKNVFDAEKLLPLDESCPFDCEG